VAASPRPANQTPAEPASVLVIDDDPRLLNLMSTAFTRAGFRTFSAKNGKVGLQILSAAKPDLLVTDIVMPEMEGLATIREAKLASPNTAVIAISGGGQYERHERFLNWAEGLGADEVLAKPFKISSLLTAARLVLDRRDEAAAAKA
jgi:DNA-binding response OmpR family regulator